MEAEARDDFKAFAEQVFRELTAREYGPHADELASLRLSEVFAAFERLVVRHHEIQVRDDQQYKQLEAQLDEISGAFELLQKDVDRLSGDKLISIKIPDKPRHLRVRSEDSSDEDANSFLPEDDATSEDVKRREKELRQLQRDKRAARQQPRDRGEEPEPEFRIPRDGLPELYQNKLEPPQAPSLPPGPLPQKPQTHVHSAKCSCRQHDHSHLLFDPHDSPEGIRK